MSSLPDRSPAAPAMDAPSTSWRHLVSRRYRRSIVQERMRISKMHHRDHMPSNLLESNVIQAEKYIFRTAKNLADYKDTVAAWLATSLMNMRVNKDKTSANRGQLRLQPQVNHQNIIASSPAQCSASLSQPLSNRPTQGTLCSVVPSSNSQYMLGTSQYFLNNPEGHSSAPYIHANPQRHIQEILRQQQHYPCQSQNSLFNQNMVMQLHMLQIQVLNQQQNNQQHTFPLMEHQTQESISLQIGSQYDQNLKMQMASSLPSCQPSIQLKQPATMQYGSQSGPHQAILSSQQEQFEQQIWWTDSQRPLMFGKLGDLEQQQEQMAPRLINGPLNMQQPMQVVNDQKLSFIQQHHLGTDGNWSVLQLRQKQQNQMLPELPLDVSNMQNQPTSQQKGRSQSSQHQLQSDVLIHASPLHQQPEVLQQEMQQIQVSRSSLQSQSTIEQQTQLLQSQSGLHDSSSMDCVEDYDYGLFAPSMADEDISQYINFEYLKEISLHVDDHPKNC